jgi:predicted RNA binding protein YcfA (HicA-like mRNA interferase family)
LLLGKKLRVPSGREVCAILESQGFALVRQRGSHIIMQRQFISITQTVPVPNHRELDRGTLAGIIVLAGVARELFEVL